MVGEEPTRRFSKIAAPMIVRQPGVRAARRWRASGNSARSRARNADGDCPARWRNSALKLPRLDRPTARHTPVTDERSRASRRRARSSRACTRHWCGVMPKTALNWRMKWYGETPARRAMAATGLVSPARSSASRASARRRKRSSPRSIALRVADARAETYGRADSPSSGLSCFVSERSGHRMWTAGQSRSTFGSRSDDAVRRLRAAARPLQGARPVAWPAMGRHSHAGVGAAGKDGHHVDLTTPVVEDRH